MSFFVLEWVWKICLSFNTDKCMFTPHPPPPPSALALLNGEEYMIIFLFPSFTPDRLL